MGTPIYSQLVKVQVTWTCDWHLKGGAASEADSPSPGGPRQLQSRCQTCCESREHIFLYK